MNRWSCSIRCAGVARDVVEAEAARLVADVSSDDEVSVAYEAGLPSLAELGVRDTGFRAAEVAQRLGGLAWFRQEGLEDRDIDLSALYLEGALVFEVMLSELLDCDEVEVGPGFVDELEPAFADLMDPRAWVMRVAMERFGQDFARITSSYGLCADEHRTIAGAGPARPSDQRDQGDEGDEGDEGDDGDGDAEAADDQAKPADDDLPF